MLERRRDLIKRFKSVIESREKEKFRYIFVLVIIKVKQKKVIMKKYEVPVVTLHKLKPCRILSGSPQAKETFVRSSANTENFEVDESFNSNSFFEN